MSRVLLVEDDANLRRVLSYHLEQKGYAVTPAADGPSALGLLGREPFDLVLTDVRMPGMDGFELLRVIGERNVEIPVVVMTAYGTISDAVEAMRLGAADYLTKPVERESLLLAVQRALRVSDLAKENRRLKQTLRDRHPEEMLLGTSPAIQESLEAIRRVAPTDATVLVTGESGTGKELAARAIHSLSNRARRAFVAINCAALPAELLESELFGHEKGSFTGAIQAKQGKFQQADTGTLFLDEIGDMDLGLQAKILRALQERTVDPVGSRQPVTVDVRLIAATNRDLMERVKLGLFREDLFWRLNVIPLRMPPLRDRREDILLLLRHFYQESWGGELRLEPVAQSLLVAYSWPGNVREIQNFCQRLAVLYPGRPITADLLPAEMREAKPEAGAGEREEAPTGLWAMEREAIVGALREHGGNRSAAARALQVPRHILLYRMKKYGLDRA